MRFSLAKEIRFLQQSLAHIACDPRSKLRVVDESNLHVTLKFLGTTEHNQLRDLTKALSTLKLKSTIETLIVGTRTAYPSSRPFSSGKTKPTAAAAPVLVGIIDMVAERARRKSV